ncbi:iron-sulfur cluster assembly accessory protein [Xanthovirga aplysinae]|uniref:iron-sulfur cluster assembly accessory protein n=1 Tax=Xanthovirga aplysinae TaxID=2529853 RepID=UPI0012BB82B2|nr:iron-sulfur cluster assembly accessory protein [Xanthovirga aplysinae]MTI33368.1 iron-sulfur cluster assembly accessory protein [Xanthovirga aplysinae]
MFENLIPISISEKAVKEIQQIMTHKNIPENYSLRVGIKGGGCGGVSLALGFDQKKENDLEFTIENIQVLVEKKHTMFLIGKEVDFYEGADTRGFMFIDKMEGNKKEKET